MGAKKVLPVYQLVTNGNMTGTVTSPIVNVQNLDNIGIQVSWSGSPIGNIFVNCSVDNVNFDALTFDPSLGVPSGSPGGYLISLDQLPFPYVQIQYVPTSGSGSFNVFIFGKDLN